MGGIGNIGGFIILPGELRVSFYLISCSKWKPYVFLVVFVFQKKQCIRCSIVFQVTDVVVGIVVVGIVVGAVQVPYFGL